MMTDPFGFAGFGESLANDPVTSVDSSRDVVGEFHDLKQTTTVAEYQEKFEELRDLMSEMNYGLSESYLISSFLSGLKQEIKLSVRNRKPETLYHAFNLARIQEIVIGEIKDELPNPGVLRDIRMRPPLTFQAAASTFPETQVVLPRNRPDSVRPQYGTSFRKSWMANRQISSQAHTLVCVVSEIFDLALMNPSSCEACVNLCLHLAEVFPDITVDYERFTLKRLLLNKCQEEFEIGERDKEEPNQSAEESMEKQLRARTRMLGNIRLIGELYKKRWLTERIIHECIKKLLTHQFQNPDEADIEALCTLMNTVGETIDHPKAKEHMDVYFDMMEKLSNNMKLSSSVRSMLKDAIDLRNNKWQQRSPEENEQVHRDVPQEYNIVHWILLLFLLVLYHSYYR